MACPLASLSFVPAAIRGGVLLHDLPSRIAGIGPIERGAVTFSGQDALFRPAAAPSQPCKSHGEALDGEPEIG